jgi:hypothetical protein
MIDSGFDELRCALVAGFDILGGAYAFVLMVEED